MAKKKDIYKVKPLNDNKRNIIQSLIEEYDIETAEDIQEAEMDEHLGYDSYERCEKDNYRNGTKRTSFRSRCGEFELEVPQDRSSSFEPQVVQKRQKDISEIDQKIISMYARGLTTRQISDQIEDIYGFECSESLISNVTDKILQDIDDCQKRSLDNVYPIVFIDTVHFSVREDHVILRSLQYM